MDGTVYMSMQVAITLPRCMYRIILHYVLNCFCLYLVQKLLVVIISHYWFIRRKFGDVRCEFLETLVQSWFSCDIWGDFNPVAQVFDCFDGHAELRHRFPTAAFHCRGVPRQRHAGAETLWMFLCHHRMLMFMIWIDSILFWFNMNHDETHKFSQHFPFPNFLHYLFTKPSQPCFFQVGSLATFFSVAQVLFTPVLGWASDKYGRRPVLLIAIAGTTASTVLTGCAWNFAIMRRGGNDCWTLLKKGPRENGEKMARVEKKDVYRLFFSDSLKEGKIVKRKVWFGFQKLPAALLTVQGFLENCHAVVVFIYLVFIQKNAFKKGSVFLKILFLSQFWHQKGFQVATDVFFSQATQVLDAAMWKNKSSICGSMCAQLQSEIK